MKRDARGAVLTSDAVGGSAWELSEQRSSRAAAGRTCVN